MKPWIILQSAFSHTINSIQHINIFHQTHFQQRNQKTWQKTPSAQRRESHLGSMIFTLDILIYILLTHINMYIYIYIWYLYIICWGCWERERASEREKESNTRMIDFEWNILIGFHGFIQKRHFEIEQKLIVNNEWIQLYHWI